MKQENVKNKKENREELVSYIRMGRELSGRQQILLVIQLSLPAIMAQLTSVAMQYIDASMVGRLGSGAAAAIGLVASTTWLFGGVCNSFSVGFAVQAAQLIGANKLEAARDVLKQALFTISCISVFLAAIGIAISSFLPGWLGGEKAILKDAGHYFLIYVCFLPCSGLNVLAGSMLQSSGNMKVPGILNSLLCLLDVLFNALFIYGCRMGVAGAALGTGVSELIIASIMLYFACVKSPILHIRKEEGFHLSAECQKKAITLSLPVTFERFVVCLAMIVTTGIVAPLGSVALAANSFAVTAESLCYMPGYGIGEAAATLVGQSTGAGRKNLVHHFSRMTAWTGIGVMTVTGILMYFLAPLMMLSLSPDPAVQALGTKVLRIEVFAEPMYAASIVASGALRGAGDTMIPSILNFISLWLVRIPLSWIMAKPFGLTGVWIAMCLELICRGILMLIRLLKKL